MRVRVSVRVWWFASSVAWSRQSSRRWFQPFVRCVCGGVMERLAGAYADSPQAEQSVGIVTYGQCDAGNRKFRRSLFAVKVRRAVEYSCPSLWGVVRMCTYDDGRILRPVSPLRPTTSVRSARHMVSTRISTTASLAARRPRAISRYDRAVTCCLRACVRACVRVTPGGSCVCSARRRLRGRW